MHIVVISVHAILRLDLPLLAPARPSSSSPPSSLQSSCLRLSGFGAVGLFCLFPLVVVFTGFDRLFVRLLVCSINLTI